MQELSVKNRPHEISNATENEFDVIVIGGGITGAGIALDASQRGLNVLLVEKKDFAFGTSSRSTKLIHGGLRYLKQLDVALVREVGKERAIVHKLAPHLVNPEKMLLPLIEGGTFGKLATSIGLYVYDLLAGVTGSDKRVMLNKGRTMTQEPILRTDILKGAGYYAEYRTDDARLTTELMKTAQRNGATIFNYMAVDEFIYENDKVVGVSCTDTLTNTPCQFKAKYTVSAAGPWVDQLRKKDNSLKGKHLFHSKGVHLVVPHEKLPLTQSIYFDVPDGRMIFAIPRDQITYIGTTDTEYKGDLNAIKITHKDVDYLLKASNNMFPNHQLEANDVVSSWAGVRPLIHEIGKSASEISRKDEVFISERGLISIAGGKLTGYRKMAEKVVDLLSDRFKSDYNKILSNCKTESTTLVPNNPKKYAQVAKLRNEVRKLLASVNVNEKWAYYLVHNYGVVAKTIIGTIDKSNSEGDSALIKAELTYCINNEAVATLSDYFMRRTGRSYFYIESIKPNIDLAKNLIQNQLGYDENEMNRQVQELNKDLELITVFVDQE